MVGKQKQPAAGGEQVLTKVLKEAIKSGKYTIGTKEVISELKSAKVVIAANVLPEKGGERDRLIQEAEKVKVPVVTVEKSSAQLGKMVGRPYRVSAVSLRVVAEADLRQLVGTPAPPAKAAE